METAKDGLKKILPIESHEIAKIGLKEIDIS